MSRSAAPAAGKLYLDVRADNTPALTLYEALGFEILDGDVEQNWVILKSGEAKIGLFQGMFEEDLLTFNPSDARVLEAALKEAQKIEQMQRSADSLAATTKLGMSEMQAELDRMERIAFWLDAYNALVVHQIVEDPAFRTFLAGQGSVHYG